MKFRRRTRIIRELRLKDVAPLVIDNELIYKRVWVWIKADPLSLWKATKRIYYNGRRRITLSDCAYSQLSEIIKEKHPQEYELNEKIKRQAFAKKNVLKRIG
ncbi:MAG: hypothetical protein AB7P01_04960 [Bacteroidia bacterium]